MPGSCAMRIMCGRRASAHYLVNLLLLPSVTSARRFFAAVHWRRSAWRSWPEVQARSRSCPTCHSRCRQAQAAAPAVAAAVCFCWSLLAGWGGAHVPPAQVAAGKLELLPLLSRCPCQPATICLPPPAYPGLHPLGRRPLAVARQQPAERRCVSLTELSWAPVCPACPQLSCTPVCPACPPPADPGLLPPGADHPGSGRADRGICHARRGRPAARAARPGGLEG